MRSDMMKVLCERPRRGGYSNTRKGIKGAILIFVEETGRFFCGHRLGFCHHEFSFEPHDQYLTGV